MLAAAVFSALAAGFAAKAANRSAAAAERAQEFVEIGLRDDLLSEILQIAHESMHGALACQTLINDTTSQLDSVFVFAGAFGSSQHEVLKDRVSQDLSALGQHERAARRIVENPTDLNPMSVDDLRAQLAVLRGSKIAIDRLDRKYIRDHANYVAQNAASRERTLSQP